MKNLCYVYGNIGYVYLASVEENDDGCVVYTFEDAWREEGLIENIAESTGSTFCYKSDGSKPLIVISNTTPGVDVNITPIVPLVQERKGVLSPKDLESLASVLTNATKVKFTAGEDGDAQSVVEVIEAFLNQTKSSDTDLYRYISPNFPAVDEVKVIVDKNSNNINKTYAVGKNETVYMSNPEAELFIKIPNKAGIIDSYRERYLRFPAKTAVMKDYDNPKCNTGEYRNFCINNPTLLKEIQGNPENNINSNKGMPGIDETNLMDEHGIYPNELNYYKSICNLLDDIVENMQKIADNGDSANPAIRTLYDDDKEPSSPEEEFVFAAKYYLTNLIECAARYNWSHTGKVTIMRDSDVEDLDSDASLGEESSGDRVIAATLGRYAYASNSYSLDSLDMIKDMYDKLMRDDPHSIAEYLVKMLRWGDRKPTKIIFSSDKVKREFDLTEFVYTKETFNFINAEKVIVDGAEYTYYGTIRTHSGLKCSALFTQFRGTQPNVPIGIMTRRYFRTPEGNEVGQDVYMSLIDVLEILHNDPKRIKGIQLNQNGTFEVTAPEEFGEDGLAKPLTVAIKEAANAAASDQRVKIYESSRIFHLALQFGVKDTSSLLYLPLIKDYLFHPKLNILLEEANFDTLEKGKELCNSPMFDAVHVLRCKISNEIMLKLAGMLAEAAMEVEFTLKDALEYANRVFDVSSNFIEEKGTTGTVNAMNALTKRMNLGNAEEEEEEMSVRDTMMQVLIDGDKDKYPDKTLLVVGDMPVFCLRSYTETYVKTVKNPSGGTMQKKMARTHYLMDSLYSLYTGNLTEDEFKALGSLPNDMMPVLNSLAKSDFSDIAKKFAAELIAIPILPAESYSKIKCKFATEPVYREFYSTFKKVK